MVRMANKRETVFDSDTNIAEVFLIVFHSFQHVVAHRMGHFIVLLEFVRNDWVCVYIDQNDHYSSERTTGVHEWITWHSCLLLVTTYST